MKLLKMKSLYSCLLLILLLVVTSFTIPRGWHKNGTDPDSYHAGVEAGAGISSSKAGTIQSARGRITGYCSLVQSFKPGRYRNKKIRLSGYMRSSDVENYAGFFLRIDGEPTGGALAFDNMEDRPIKGTTGWTRYEITLSVSDNAREIVLGAILNGPGKIWFDNIHIDVIDEPTDKKGTIIYKGPVNLNFEE